MKIPITYNILHTIFSEYHCWLGARLVHHKLVSSPILLFCIQWNVFFRLPSICAISFIHIICMFLVLWCRLYSLVSGFSFLCKSVPGILLWHNKCCCIDHLCCEPESTTFENCLRWWYYSRILCITYAYQVLSSLTYIVVCFVFNPVHTPCQCIPVKHDLNNNITSGKTYIPSGRMNVQCTTTYSQRTLF